MSLAHFDSHFVVVIMSFLFLKPHYLCCSFPPSTNQQPAMPVPITARKMAHSQMIYPASYPAYS